MTLTQPGLPLSILHTLDLKDCAQKRIPYLSGIRLHDTAPGEALNEKRKRKYQRATGILRYLSDSTRPDLSYITGQMASHMQNPIQHRRALLQVARYVQATINRGLFYTASSRIIHAQSAFDFAGCPDTRKSTYGNIIFLCTNPISWCSRRIKTTVRSTFEAKYIKASNTARHAIWIRSLVQELVFPNDIPVPLAMDNRAAIQLAKNTSPTKRSKYIAIRYHYLRDHVALGNIATAYIPGEYLTADIMTKPLPAIRFTGLRDTIPIRFAPSPDVPGAVGS